MAGRIVDLLKQVLNTAQSSSGRADAAESALPSGVISSHVDDLSDEELRLLNELLPWAAFVTDRHGRRFGKAHSIKKRAEPQRIPDRRIVELDRRFGLTEKTVLEIGCFEGIHTVALAQRAKRVVAVDGRIENVVKTIVRCALFGVHPTVLRWNVECGPPAGFDASFDVLHHVGVLYHLTDPVAHLRALAPSIRHTVMLDTHVAPADGPLSEYESGGKSYRYYVFKEGGRADPFSGMYEQAKWLREEDLVALLMELGFRTIDVTERRAERNGPRILLFASR